jgi:hypothetical protein
MKHYVVMNSKGIEVFRGTCLRCAIAYYGKLKTRKGYWLFEDSLEDGQDKQVLISD